MANTIINPKPAHLSGDSAKFHSKVGGKSHKGRKTHKGRKGRKSMKSKKSRKTMRKTMGKKSGGDCNKRITKMLGFNFGTSYKDCLLETLNSISDDKNKIIVDSLKKPTSKNWWMQKLREQYGNEYNKDTTCSKFSFGKSTMHKFYDKNINEYANTLTEVNKLHKEFKKIKDKFNNAKKDNTIIKPDETDPIKEQEILRLIQQFENMNIRSKYEEQIIDKLQDFCTGYD